MKKTTAYSFLLICIAFTSCKGEVDVVVDRAIDDSLNGPISIVIDGKHEYKNITDTSFALKLKPGTHQLKINNGKEQEFKVGDDGGILNISNQEYVAFEIQFQKINATQEEFDINEMRVRFPTIVDSFYISIKTRPDEVVPDTTILKNIPYINGEKRSLITDEIGLAGLRNVGKNQLFIDKFWDYNMTDTIPRQVSEMHSNKTTTRSTIRRANIFLLLAQVNDEQYFVRSIPKAKREVAKMSQVKN